MNEKLKQIALVGALAALTASPVFAQGNGGGGGGNGGGNAGNNHGMRTGANQIRQNEVARSPGVNLTLSPATVRAIQQQLNSAGYAAGPVDGQWGQQTTKALLDYQKARGLEPTGNIDLRTLASLGINPGGMLASNASGGGNMGGAGGGAGVRSNEGTVGGNAGGGNAGGNRNFSNNSGGAGGGAGGGATGGGNNGNGG